MGSDVNLVGSENWVPKWDPKTIDKWIKKQPKRIRSKIYHELRVYEAKGVDPYLRACKIREQAEANIGLADKIIHIAGGFAISKILFG